MEYQNIAQKVVKEALRNGVHEAEVYLQNSREFEVQVRNGEIESITESRTKGMGLRVFKDKKLGFSYTSDFTPESLQEFTKKTVRLSEVGDPKPWNGLPDFTGRKQKDLDLFDPTISEIENNKKVEIAKEVEKLALAYDKRIKNTEGGRFMDADVETLLVNSKGVFRKSRSTYVGFGTAVIAGEGNNMQYGSWSSSKIYFKDLESIEEVARKAGQRAVEKLGAKGVKTQKVPVLLDRYATPSFWYGILLAINGDRLYKKTTFLTDSLHKPVASELITLTDNPTLSRHISSTPFDGEGKITRENILVDKGILKLFIYDTITARKAGVDVPTIAQRGGYKSTPYGSFINVIVKNGNIKREDLIKSLDKGFYVKGLRGIGTDIPTGNFSVGASGFWVEKGEIVHPVDGVTLGGDSREILKNIKVLANDLDIRGGLNSPSFLVSEMAVGGE